MFAWGKETLEDKRPRELLGLAAGLQSRLLGTEASIGLARLGRELATCLLEVAACVELRLGKELHVSHLDHPARWPCDREAPMGGSFWV